MEGKGGKGGKGGGRRKRRGKIEGRNKGEDERREKTYFQPTK